NDFRGRGRAAIDQHDHLLSVGDVAQSRVGPLRLLDIAAPGQHDRTPVEKIIRHGNRLVEQAAGIVAEIDDVALELRADRLLQIANRLFQIGGRLLVEAGDVNVGDVVFRAVFHRLDADDVADHADVEGFVHALPQDGESD